MYSPKRESVNKPNIYWQQALDLPGAIQMKYVKRLMVSRPLLERFPDQSLVIENNLNAYERIQATRGMDYIFVYSALGKPFNVNMGKITGNKVLAYWFNPRNGEVSEGVSYENKGIIQFIPPSLGYGLDWILVLDDSSKGYAKP
jgi:hypothetical protein